MVEVYSAWSGPCLAVIPMCKKVKIEYEDESTYNYLVTKSDGIEELAEYRNLSEPRFIVYRNGKVLDTVVGCHVPHLERLIRGNVPNDASADDPEENPRFLQRRERLADEKAAADAAAAAAAAGN